MPPFRIRRRKYRKGAKRVGRKSYAPKTRASVNLIKKVVSKMLSKQVEKKTYQYLGTSYDILPSNSPGYDANIIPCSPAAGYLAIQQSNAQNGRSGNRIRIKSLRLSGVMFPTGYNAVTNLTPAPVQVKIWFFVDKEDPQGIPTPAASADFFQFGSSSLGFQNELFDHTMPINTDRYRVLTTRTYKLGYSSYVGTGAQPQQGNFANNDFKFNAKVNVNLTKYAIKNVVYRDNNANPTSRGIFMMAQPLYANGNPIGSTQIPAKMEFMLTVDYTDL